jgi:hypothetical protein
VTTKTRVERPGLAEAAQTCRSDATAVSVPEGLAAPDSAICAIGYLGIARAA